MLKKHYNNFFYNGINLIYDFCLWNWKKMFKRSFKNNCNYRRIRYNKDLEDFLPLGNKTNITDPDYKF